jgi:hypothetical protein
VRHAEQAALWRRLVDAGLVAGECPPAVPDAGPWYVRAMLGVAGWIGSLFLFALAVGLGVCAGAYAIYRNAGHNDFAAQFAFAVSLAGQGLVGYGLAATLEGAIGSALFLFALFEAGLALAMPSWLHRVWSSVAAGFLLEYASITAGVHGLGYTLCATGFALVWLNEPAWGRHHEILRPIGYGLALALLPLGASPIWGLDLARLFHGDDALSALALWFVRLAPLLLAAVFLLAVERILGGLGIARSGAAGLTAFACAGGAMLAAWYVPGLGAALLVLVVGYAAGNAVLVGLGTMAALAMLSRYYYLLSATLLEKAGVLIAIGVALLLLRAILRRRWPSPGMRDA